MIIKRILCCLLVFTFVANVSAQVDEDSVSAEFFRDFYHQGHLAHWLDALCDHTVYQGLHVGQWDESGQLIFTIDGNSFRWNRFYIDGFRTDSRFTAGSSVYVPNMENYNLRIDNRGSILKFERDTLARDYVSTSSNSGNLGGISHGSADIIHLFHGTGTEDAYDPSTIDERQYIKNQHTVDAAYTFGGYRQHLYACIGEFMLPNYDQNGLIHDEPLYAASHDKLQLDGQLPAGQWLDRVGYFINFSDKDNYGSEFYMNRAEVMNLTNYSASLYASRGGLTTGLTFALNDVSHNDLQFSRNVIDQDGESLEPWMPDGRTSELTWALNYSHTLLPWLTVKADGFNSLITFKPDQTKFINDIFYQHTGQEMPTYLYRYVWTSNAFSAGLLENRIGVEAHKKLSDALNFASEVALTVDGIMLSGKSKISPNIEAAVNLDYQPFKWLNMGLTLAHNRVSYNIEDLRFMSNDYMNADVYFAGDDMKSEVDYAGHPRLFTTSGGRYHHYANHLMQSGYFTVNIPVYLHFGKHEFAFLQTYKKFHHTWMAQFEGGADANGYTDSEGFYFMNPGQRNYIVDYLPKSMMGSHPLLNTPFYVTQNSRYTYHGESVLFSLSWQSMMGAGLSALGNGPASNNIGVLSESTANPNTFSTIENSDGKYPGVGRLDQDKAYVCRIYLAHNVNRYIQYGITGRWTDGQPFVYFNTATSTDQNGDTQMAIRPYCTRGINPTDGNFGCRESALFNIDLHARFALTTALQHEISLNILCYNIYDFGNVYNEMCFPEGSRGAGKRGANMTLTIPRGVVATLKFEF
ncbi:MAG: hypothetical protein J6T98_02030 [Salinivirgaceae bacterium]|nr:hypothetical protein [Salinivirgaceae bacterium]